MNFDIIFLFPNFEPLIHKSFFRVGMNIIFIRNINDIRRTQHSDYGCLNSWEMPDLVNAAKIDHWNSESDLQVIVAENICV